MTIADPKVLIPAFIISDDVLIDRNLGEMQKGGGGDQWSIIAYLSHTVSMTVNYSDSFCAVN